MTVIDTSWTPVRWIVEGTERWTKVHLVRVSPRGTSLSWCGRIAGLSRKRVTDLNVDLDSLCRVCWKNRSVRSMMSS